MVIIHYVEFTLKPTKPVSYEGNRGYKSTLSSVILSSNIKMHHES